MRDKRQENPNLSTRTRRNVKDALDRLAADEKRSRSKVMEDLVKEGLRRRGYLQR